MNKFKVFFFIVLISCFGLYKYYKTNNCIPLKEVLNIDLNKEIFLINVSDNKYFNDFHIKDSIHIPYEFFTNDFIKTLDKKKTYIFYCSDYSCNQSYICAEILIKKGFYDVYVYGGGSQEWYTLSKEFPLEYLYNGKAQEKYLNNYMVMPYEYKIQLEDQLLNPQYYTKLCKVLSANILQKKINEIHYIL